MMIIWPRATLKLELTATTYYSIVFCIKHNICPPRAKLSNADHCALFENNKFDIFFSSSHIEHKRACAIWSNLIHTLWACADAIWVRNSNHLMSWDTKEVSWRLIMVSTDPNSFTAFFFYIDSFCLHFMILGFSLTFFQWAVTALSISLNFP